MQFFIGKWMKHAILVGKHLKKHWKLYEKDQLENVAGILQVMAI